MTGGVGQAATQVGCLPPGAQGGQVALPASPTHPRTQRDRTKDAAVPLQRGVTPGNVRSLPCGDDR